MKAIANFEYAQLDGDYSTPTPLGDITGSYGDITKGSAKFATFYGLEDWIDYDMILRLKLRGTYINRKSDEKLPTAEKLFMGGVGSVRGFNPYSLSPYYVDEFGVRRLIGGTQRASGSLEASVPLSEAAKMRLAFFYDYGYIGLDNNEFEGNIIENDISRSSTGVVLEWQSAFGLINLVFAYPIDDVEGDQTATFEFTMGSQF